MVPSILNILALLATAWATARAMSGIPPREMIQWGKYCEPARGLPKFTARFGCMWIVAIVKYIASSYSTKINYEQVYYYFG